MMKKRHKAILPLLCLAVIVFGTIAIYLNKKDGGLEGDRAALQACDQARANAQPDLGPTDKPGSLPVLKDCDRQNK